MEKIRELESLAELAVALGASQAKALGSDQIVVEDRLAGFCVEPRCPTYGLSASCPPHVSGPAGFRQMQQSHPYAVVVKLDVPASVLFGNDRPLVMRVMHEIVAAVEQEAVRLSYVQAQAFAGGSCKMIFCEDEPNCAKIATGECRHPEESRPSLSGFGVNVSKLMKSCGWDTKIEMVQSASDDGKMSWVAGLVLFG